MMKMVVCSVLNLFVIMLHSQLVLSQLPDDQVSAMSSVYEILQNNTFPSFVWNDVLKASNPCSWKGVGCTPDNSSINTISFEFFSISTSEFLPFLCNIDTLESVDVSGNQVSSIPDGFFTGCGGISGLKILNFSGNNLIGSLPSFKNGFRVLETLDFSRNFFSGEIGLQFKGMDALKILSLRWNQFSGKIPIEMGMFKNLSLLNLANNRLNGTLPPSLGNLTNLRVLNLESNYLVGEIPPQILMLSSLEGLNMSRNLLNGSIPLYISDSIRVLDLHGNNLRGPIPDSVSELCTLLELHLGSNQLSGRIPAMPQRLHFSLNLSHNLFSGPIPNTLSKLHNLEVLDLSNNRFSGGIPSFLNALSSLTHLLLTNNDLSGVRPDFRDNLEVDTKGNKFLVDGRENATLTTPQRETKPSLNSGFATGFPVGLIISMIAIYISKRYSKIYDHLSPPNSIIRSTIDFKKAMESAADPSNITVKARLSTFYKVAMPSGSTYLVKKIIHSHNILKFPRHEQLSDELEALGSLSNPNVMIPVAYVLTARRAYLFYAFARGMLHDILHHRVGEKMEWRRRYAIAVGVARGLAFLHGCSSGPIVLLDLSTKSILLKSLDEPLISDIELCKLIHPSDYGCRERATAAGNVYSYGVLLLELLTGKPAMSGEGVELAEWALTFSEEKSQRGKILDSSLTESEGSIVVRNQMLGVLETALACVSSSPEMRPNMENVVEMLLCASSK